MTKRILVCEDEDAIREFVVINLRRAGYDVVDVPNGEEALRVYEESRGEFGLALLDIMMPGIDGFTVCKRLREKDQSIGIIMLSAKSQEMDKVNGLMLGADDYVTKPFLPLELVARIKSQLRRYKKYNPSHTGEGEQELLSHLGLVLNGKTHECTLNGKALVLTPTEFAILRILLENRGRVIGAEELFHAIWQDEYYSKSNNTIPVHIRHLREKLNDTLNKPKYIKTIWGVGYKIEES